MTIMGFWQRLRGILHRPKSKGEAALAPGERIQLFQERTGVEFRDPSLLRLALTHRSYLGSSEFDPLESNERLEFLGDAVVELIVIEYLFHRFGDDLEGELTRKKSLLVSRNILAERAERMNLGHHVLMSDAERESGGSVRTSILADSFEAVVGAIYLDRGLDAARAFLQKSLLANAEGLLKDREHRNYKSELQELLQSRFKYPPRYRVVKEVGPEHRKIFTVQAEHRGKVLGTGTGSNKKEAEQSAARNALEQGIDG